MDDRTSNLDGIPTRPNKESWRNVRSDEETAKMAEADAISKKVVGKAIKEVRLPVALTGHFWTIEIVLEDGTVLHVEPTGNEGEYLDVTAQ